MALTPTPQNIIKFITLLSPFMLTSYLVLESFFRQDLKGLIFLAGALLVSIVGLLFRLVFKSPRPVDSHAGCNVLEFTMLQLNEYSAPAFHTLFLFYSLVYLCANMWVTGNWNVGVFITLVVLCLTNMYTRISLHCVTSSDVVLGALFGIVLGGCYYALIYFTRPEWTYFSESASDRQYCRRIGTTKFRCTLKKA